MEVPSAVLPVVELHPQAVVVRALMLVRRLQPVRVVIAMETEGPSTTNHRKRILAQFATRWFHLRRFVPQQGESPFLQGTG